jgi:hypothetical protein
MLEFLFRFLIILHICTGTLALFASVIAFSTSKWSVWHRRAGIVFFWAMLITSLASIPPAIAHEKWVLMMISVFSFHLTYTGRRYLAFRRKEQPVLFDYVTTVMIAVFGLLLLTVGVPAFVGWMGPWGAAAPGAFGSICLAMAREDYKWYRSDQHQPKLALLRHIGRMGGATIAAFTAFLVNVNFFIPGAFAWILPTVIGSFLIARYSRMLRKGERIR